MVGGADGAQVTLPRALEVGIEPPLRADGAAPTAGSALDSEIVVGFEPRLEIVPLMTELLVISAPCRVSGPMLETQGLEVTDDQQVWVPGFAPAAATPRVKPPPFTASSSPVVSRSAMSSVSSWIRGFLVFLLKVCSRVGPARAVGGSQVR